MGLLLRISIVVGIAVGFLTYFALFSPPSAFPDKLLVRIESGDTGQDIAHELTDEHAIRSEFAFRILLRLYGAHTHIKAGTYYFSRPQNAFSIAWRMRVGNFDLEAVRVTLPEGTNVRQMAGILSEHIGGFNTEAFLKLALPQEGYLFPDTYFFYHGESAQEIVEAMRDNFDAQRAASTTQQALKNFKKPFSDVLVMASLLEKEAPDTTNRQIIAGILWRRLAQGMPLQVDAVFPYITGKSGNDILQSDYAVDSPYNTYTHTGLPPGPITNPGLDAIIAAATPITTAYLYYLSDKDGVFHYSKTFDEQLANQKKYLP
jgi:UPF0755 protein